MRCRDNIGNETWHMVSIVSIEAVACLPPKSTLTTRSTGPLAGGARGRLAWFVRALDEHR